MSTKFAIAAQKMRAVYIEGWENILSIRPDLEGTQPRMLDPDFVRRFFTHIETHGVAQCDLENLSFRIMAAKLGVVNSPVGWQTFIEGAPRKGLL